VPAGLETVVPVGRGVENHGLHAADERVLRKRAVRHVGLVLGEDGQHAVSGDQLGRTPAAYGGRLVDHGEHLVPGLQALGDVVDDDVVQHVTAAVVEGTDVITGGEISAG